MLQVLHISGLGESARTSMSERDLLWLGLSLESLRMAFLGFNDAGLLLLTRPATVFYNVTSITRYVLEVLHAKNLITSNS